MLKQILFGGESGLSFIGNAGIALLRIFAGVALMLGHGIGKLPPSDQFIERTGALGFPVPVVFAWAAAFSEFLGGAFLALGFLTRVSSFFIICVMLTALIGVHWNDPFDRQEKAFLFLFIALAFLLKGASDWSIDAFLRRK
jgi:putative oxidoreductase